MWAKVALLLLGTLVCAALETAVVDGGAAPLEAVPGTPVEVKPDVASGELAAVDAAALADGGVPPDESVAVPDDYGSADGAADDGGDEHPNYDAELHRLKALCKSIKQDMKEVFALKNHHQQEAMILAHAATLGEHMDAAHTKFATSHHKEWTCAQARDVLRHEHARGFVNHFERWYDGKDLNPPVSHKEAVRLVTHLRDELSALRLTNVETEREMDGILQDLNDLEKWYIELRRTYDALTKDADSASCEQQFHRFMEVLHELHGEAVPEWFHLAEGTQLLAQQCDDDPQLNDEL